MANVRYSRALEEEFRANCAAIEPDALRFLESQKEALSGLYEPDEEVRDLALFALTYFWELRLDVARLCEKWISCSDPGLRAGAAIYLGYFHFGMDDQAIACLLACRVVSENEDENVRAVAYTSLLRVLKGKNMTFSEEPYNLRFPQDVDWKLVTAHAKKPPQTTN